MLILTRKKGQCIMMGPNAEIKVAVLDIRGGQVKIGIEAPRDLDVHRAEIYLEIQSRGPRKQAG